MRRGDSLPGFAVDSLTSLFPVFCLSRLFIPLEKTGSHPHIPFIPRVNSGMKRWDVEMAKSGYYRISLEPLSSLTFPSQALSQFLGLEGMKEKVGWRRENLHESREFQDVFHSRLSIHRFHLSVSCLYFLFISSLCLPGWTGDKKGTEVHERDPASLLSVPVLRYKKP